MAKKSYKSSRIFSGFKKNNSICHSEWLVKFPIGKGQLNVEVSYTLSLIIYEEIEFDSPIDAIDSKLVKNTITSNN